MEFLKELRLSLEKTLGLPVEVVEYFDPELNANKTVINITIPDEDNYEIIDQRVMEEMRKHRSAFREQELSMPAYDLIRAVAA